MAQTDRGSFAHVDERLATTQIDCISMSRFRKNSDGLTPDSSYVHGARALELGAVGAEETDSDEREADMLHARYASLLTKKGPFTFIRRNAIDRTLSQYCVREAMEETRLPLVVIGGGGIGKSAALANWAERRASTALMQNQQLREFVFLHHVGASRDSVELFHMLRRLIHAIQERFGLPISLQNTEEGLCRELPRILQAAASRCSGVVILVDGIDKVMTIDGSRAGLKWLPFVLPSKTRFILTITEEGDGWRRYMQWHSQANSSSGGYRIRQQNEVDAMEFEGNDNGELPKASIIVTEIARRGWETYRFPTLEKAEQVKIIDRFLDTPRNVHGHGKLHQHASFSIYQDEMSKGNTFLTSVDIDEHVSLTLKLMDAHVDKILDHPLACYPQFLSSVLVCLAFLSDHGFCVNFCLDKFLSCKSFRELFACQLGLWEDGFKPTPGSMETARSIANRSKLYVPDSSCHKEIEDDVDTLGNAVAHMNVRPEALLNRPKSRVQVLRTSTAGSAKSSLGYSNDSFESSGQYSEDGFENESGDSVGSKMLSRGLGRSRSYSSNVDVVKANDYGHFSDSLVKEHAAVALQAAFRGFKTRNDGHNSPSSKRKIQKSKSAAALQRHQNKSSVPPYLLGGTYVKGVADWLGQALAASFVSRVGLSVAELFDVLEYIARDDLEEYFESQVGEGNNKSGIAAEGLAEETKLALLRALDSIGAINTNGDIWIPMSSVRRRREIRNRYMKGQRGEYILSLTSDGIYMDGLETIPTPTIRWRHHLIRFFKRLPPCKRRAHEVPYHLEGTGRWHGLKDALADLDTFRVLWTSGNRSRWELYRMWKTLSGVRLDDVALSKHASSSGVNLSRSWSSTTPDVVQAVVDDSDDEISRGQFSIRRASGVNAVKLPKTVYDVVGEYNYSISQWYVIEEPHSGKLVWTLEQLSLFFLGFGDFEDEMNLPEYLVPHIDENELRLIGFDMWPDHLKGTVKRPSNAPKEKGHGRPPAANSVKSAKKKKKKTSAGTDINQPQPSFFGSELKANDEGNQHEKIPKTVAEEQEVIEELDHKLYRRWVWIMFPWLALAKADHVVPPMSSIMNPNELPYKKKSFWEVKKIDPKGPPKINASPIQIKSQLNAEKKLLESAITSPLILRQREEIRKRGNRSSHEDAYKIAMKRVKGKKKPSREESLRNIPFSSPTKRTLSSGTRFPTVEKLERDNPERRMVLFNTGIVSKEHQENETSALIKILPPSHEFESGSTKHLASHSQTYPATERDANIAGLNQMIARLREELDSLTYEREEKVKVLDALENKVGTRNFMDDYTQDCIAAGENMIEVLNARIDRLQSALRDGERLGKFYKKVQVVCQRYPAKDEVHLQRIERRLTVGNSRSDFLKARQQAAIYEYNHLMNVEKPALLKESRRAEEMMEEAVSRLKNIRRRMQREQEKEIAREKKREMMRNTVVQEDLKSTKTLAAANVLSMLSKTATKQKLQETKIDEAEYEAAFAKIKNATGISDPNMVFIKFINKDQVYASLEEQRKKYEEKIAMLDKKSDELTITLSSLQNANNAVSSRHIREIDDQTFVSESRLHLEKIRWNGAQQLLKDVQGGTTHLCSMLGLKDHRAQSIVKSDINKSKASYVMLDPKAVGKQIERRLSEIENCLTNMLKALPKDQSAKEVVDDPNYTPSNKTRPKSQGSSIAHNALRYEVRVPSRGSQMQAEIDGLEAAKEEIAMIDEDETLVYSKIREELKSREKEAIRLRRRAVVKSESTSTV